MRQCAEGPCNIRLWRQGLLQIADSDSIVRKDARTYAIGQG